MGGKWRNELPTGVKVTSDNFKVTFQYKGVRCRETINLVPTEANAKHVTNMIAAIRYEIVMNIFDYDKYFPESITKTARRFGKLRSKKTVEDYYKDIDDNWSDYVSESAAVTYKRDSKWSRKEFGHFLIQELATGDIRSWVKKQRHLTKSTIRNRLTPLRAILNIAIDDELIHVSPAANIKFSKGSKGLLSKEQRNHKVIIDPFNRNEIDAILQAAATYNDAALNYFTFALYTGCRPAEIAGLKWKHTDTAKSNIDFINRTVDINETRVFNAGRVIVKLPKTKESIRLIDLSPLAYEALKRQQSQSRFNSEYVFPRFDRGNYKPGDPLSHGDQYYKPWNIILKAAGVRHRAPKYTRHTYASQMLSGGENVAYVSKQLGHETIQVTLDRYGTFIKNTDGVKVFESAFAKNEPEK